PERGGRSAVTVRLLAPPAGHQDARAARRSSEPERDGSGKSSGEEQSRETGPLPGTAFASRTYDLSTPDAEVRRHVELRGRRRGEGAAHTGASKAFCSRGVAWRRRVS